MKLPKNKLNMLLKEKLELGAEVIPRIQSFYSLFSHKHWTAVSHIASWSLTSDIKDVKAGSLCDCIINSQLTSLPTVPACCFGAFPFLFLLSLLFVLLQYFGLILFPVFQFSLWLTTNVTTDIRRKILLMYFILKILRSHCYGALVVINSRSCDIETSYYYYYYCCYFG